MKNAINNTNTTRKVSTIQNFVGCGHEINEQNWTKNHIKVKGHKGFWSVIDSTYYENRGWFYLLEHETYGDEAACVIIDKDYNLIVDDVWNGFFDLEEYWEFENETEIEIKKKDELAPNVLSIEVIWKNDTYSFILKIEDTIPIYYYHNGKKPEDFILFESSLENVLGLEVKLPF